MLGIKIDKSKLDRIEDKLAQIEKRRQQAVNQRIRELQKSEVPPSKINTRQVRHEFQDFRARVKELYVRIWQGNQQIAIHKTDLIRQIKDSENDLQSIQIQQRPMNPNSHTNDIQIIAEWFHSFPYPHCRKANSLAALRTGVAIAQVLTDKLPSSYHSLFLPQIQIYNPNSQRCLLNLKVLLAALIAYFEDQNKEVGIDDFTAQGLYYDHNMMQTFILNVLMPLQTTKTQPAPIVQLQTRPKADLSDIANLSSIIVSTDEHQKYPNSQQHQIVNKPSIPTDTISNQSQSNFPNYKITNWLLQNFHIDAKLATPEQIIGQVVNSIFAGSRLDTAKIVKQSHYDQGPVAVFRKAGEYLLGCERMAKQNVLELLQQIETGNVRQQVFWSVIQDLMLIKASHNLKTSKKSLTKSTSKSRYQSNDLVPVNHHNIPRPVTAKDSKKTKKENPQYSLETILKAEEWIRNDLGYEHSLNKSKAASTCQSSPLLNGVLLGSIVMRLQIGKIVTIKQPKNKQEVDRNMAEVANCVIKRGFESGRKFHNFKSTYNNYLGIIWDIKAQLTRKVQQDKNRRAEQQKDKKQLTRQITESQQLQITEWLKTRNIHLQSFPRLPASTVSQVCGDVLQMRLIRQTTRRIRETNMQKILNQLRRLGWENHCTVEEVLSEDGNGLRWSMLKFTQELIEHKIYYYR